MNEFRICFPPHRSDLFKCTGTHSLFERKKNLLQARQISCWMDGRIVFEIPNSPRLFQFVTQQVLPAARIWFLDEDEWYFMEDGDTGPFSPVNELESLSTILFELRSLLSSCEAYAKNWLQPIEREILGRIDSLASVYDPIYSDNILYQESDPSCDVLVNWALSQGVRGKVMIADISQEVGRGLVAMEDIEIGDVVLEIPLSLGVSDGLELPMVQDFKRENTKQMLSWILEERQDKNSKFNIYFELLPKEFKTGLLFSDDAKMAIIETELYCGLATTKQYAKSWFEELRLEFSGEISRELFDWAYGLWFSHGIKALLPNGKRKRCLVPFAGFFNHSLFPHVMHCEWGKNTLKFIASRRCSKGAQCYLYYGNMSSHKLILDYGFIPKGINYNDVVGIISKLSDGYEEEEEDFLWEIHMIRGLGENGGETRPMKHLHSFLIVTDENVKKCGESWVKPTTRMIHDLKKVLENRLPSFNFVSDPSRGKDLSNWDVKLALASYDIDTAIFRECLGVIDLLPVQ